MWIVEQKEKEGERRYLEHVKKLKEEKQIEELKRLQVEAGIIPESSLQKIEWMYSERNPANNANSAEDYLLGKTIKDV